MAKDAGNTKCFEDFKVGTDMVDHFDLRIKDFVAEEDENVAKKEF